MPPSGDRRGHEQDEEARACRNSENRSHISVKKSVESPRGCPKNAAIVGAATATAASVMAARIPEVPQCARCAVRARCIALACQNGVVLSVLLISTYDMGRQPFGLASPAAWLREAGVEAVCVDLARERLSQDAVKAATMVAFFLPMHTATRLALPVIDRVRRSNPAARARGLRPLRAAQRCPVAGTRRRRRPRGGIRRGSLVRGRRAGAGARVRGARAREPTGADMRG